MSITIDQGISIESLHTALIDGTVSNPASVRGVEVFDNDGNDLGAATVYGSGTWTFDAFFDSQIFLHAVETDTSGNTQTSDTLGIFRGDPLPGQIASAHYFEEGGEAYTVFNARGRALYDGLASGNTNNDAVESVTGRGGAGIAYADTDFGREIIENFRVGGPRHDTLNLADSGLHTLAQVLRHTTMNGGSATIHTDNETSVTLYGVTKQQIAVHRQDFVFTGGHVLAG